MEESMKIKKILNIALSLSLLAGFAAYGMEKESRLGSDVVMSEEMGLAAKYKNINAAISARDFLAVQEFLRNNAYPQEEKDALLHMAARYNNTGIIGLLLERGANPLTIFNEVFNEEGEDLNSFHKALKYNKIKAAQVFIDHGYDIHLEKSDELSYAWDQGEDAIGLLIRNGAGFNKKGRDGLTVLQREFKENYADSSVLVEIFCKYGANINVKDEKGRTLLFDAVKNADERAVKSLIEYGIDVSSKDTSGITASEYAEALFIAQFAEQSDLDIEYCEDLAAVRDLLRPESIAKIRDDYAVRNYDAFKLLAKKIIEPTRINEITGRVLEHDKNGAIASACAPKLLALCEYVKQTEQEYPQRLTKKVKN
jgi:hypothetical protein